MQSPLDLNTQTYIHKPSAFDVAGFIQFIFKDRTFYRWEKPIWRKKKHTKTLIQPVWHFPKSSDWKGMGVTRKIRVLDISSVPIYSYSLPLPLKTLVTK